MRTPSPRLSQRRLNRRRDLVVAAGAALLLACGGASVGTPADTTPAPVYGAIQITAGATGPVYPGPAYYRVSLDSGALRLLKFDSTLTIDSVTEGPHRATIDLLRPQCGVPDTSVTASVTAANTTVIHFAISCQVIWGFLAIDLPATGPNQPTALMVTLDGQAIGGASPNTAGLMFPFIQAGGHSVGLSGAGANCPITEPNPQNTTVPLDDTVHVSFTLTCS